MDLRIYRFTDLRHFGIFAPFGCKSKNFLTKSEAETKLFHKFVPRKGHFSPEYLYKRVQKAKKLQIR